MLHTTPAQSENTPSTLPQVLADFVASLKRTRSPKTLVLHQKRLQFLAQNFDPFAPTPESECMQILAFYKLTDLAQDPFRFTNVVLQMLDLLEEKLKATAP
jgi:hypothetical protein